MFKHVRKWSIYYKKTVRNNINRVTIANLFTTMYHKAIKTVLKVKKITVLIDLKLATVGVAYL